jgi:hypothetical protein
MNGFPFTMTWRVFVQNVALLPVRLAAFAMMRAIAWP